MAKRAGAAMRAALGVLDLGPSANLLANCVVIGMACVPLLLHARPSGVD